MPRRERASAHCPRPTPAWTEACCSCLSSGGERACPRRERYFSLSSRDHIVSGRRGVATRAKHACGSPHGKKEASLRAPVRPARTSPPEPPAPGPPAAPGPPSPASPRLSPSPGCARLCVRPGPGSGTKPGRLRPPCLLRRQRRGEGRRCGARVRLRGEGLPAPPPPLSLSPVGGPAAAPPPRRAPAARRCPATPPGGAGRGRRPARGSRSDLCRVPQPRRHPARTPGRRAPSSYSAAILLPSAPWQKRGRLPHQLCARVAPDVGRPPRAPPRAAPPAPPQRGAGAPPAPSPAPLPLPGLAFFPADDALSALWGFPPPTSCPPDPAFSAFRGGFAGLSGAEGAALPRQSPPGPVGHPVPHPSPLPAALSHGPASPPALSPRAALPRLRGSARHCWVTERKVWGGGEGNGRNPLRLPQTEPCARRPRAATGIAPPASWTLIPGSGPAARCGTGGISGSVPKPRAGGSPQRSGAVPATAGAAGAPAAGAGPLRAPLAAFHRSPSVKVCKIASLGTGAGLSPRRNTARTDPEAPLQLLLLLPPAPRKAPRLLPSALSGTREDFRRALAFRPDRLPLCGVSCTPGGVRRRSRGAAFLMMPKRC